MADMSKMKAVVAHGAGDLRVDSIPRPTPGPGEVLMKIAYAGVCGSDLGYANQGVSGTAVMKEPLVLGHEVSGVVVEVGEGVDESMIGVAGAAYPATNVGGHVLPERIKGRTNLYPEVRYFGSAAMYPHTDGGMAEYKCMRADQVRVLPEGVDLKRAAVAEPLAVGLHAIKRAEDFVDGGVAGKEILVNGSGPIGLLLMAGAKALGASRVIAADTARPALDRALAIGADQAVLIGEDDLPEDIEIIFESSGAPRALGNVLSATARGGLLVQVGNLPATPIEASLGQLVTREVTWIGSFRFSNEMDLALELLADGLNVDPILSHEFSIDDAVEAFATASDRNSGASKVMIRIS